MSSGIRISILFRGILRHAYLRRQLQLREWMHVRGIKLFRSDPRRHGVQRDTIHDHGRGLRVQARGIRNGALDGLDIAAGG